MTDLEKINEMLEMQDALNKAILKEMNIPSIPIERFMFALLDEIGELTHELKGDWYKWKKTQSPVDRKKVLEELVDVWHFSLCIYIRYFNLKYQPNTRLIISYNNSSLIDAFLYVLTVQRLEAIIVLTKKLGFTIDDIYTEYKRKNQVNYERLNNGY